MTFRNRRDKALRECGNMRRCINSPLILFCLISLFSGCATPTDGNGRGRIYAAAINAATSPETWVPAAGALVFQVNDMDEEVSDWASRETPLFGSRDNALHASDLLRDSSITVYFVTAFAKPGDESGGGTQGKGKEISVGIAAIAATGSATVILKHGTARTRPDGENNQSFPSAHASISSVSLTLASANLDDLSLTKKGRKGLRFGFSVLKAGTAWARVEAKKHYPSDVLAGAALGNFLGLFFNEAFLSPRQRENATILVEPVWKGAMIKLIFTF